MKILKLFSNYLVSLIFTCSLGIWLTSGNMYAEYMSKGFIIFALIGSLMVFFASKEDKLEYSKSMTDKEFVFDCIFDIIILITLYHHAQFLFTGLYFIHTGILFHYRFKSDNLVKEAEKSENQE